MGQVKALFDADFRLWLLGQYQRTDRVGHAARYVLSCARCTGVDERELVEHASRDHRRAEVLALITAVHEWRRLNDDAFSDYFL